MLRTRHSLLVILAACVLSAGCTSSKHDWSETEQAWAGASNTENDIRVFEQRREEAQQRADEYAGEQARVEALLVERRKNLVRTRAEADKAQAELTAAQKALEALKAEQAKVAAEQAKVTAEIEAARAKAASRPAPK